MTGKQTWLLATVLIGNIFSRRYGSRRGADADARRLRRPQ